MTTYSMGSGELRIRFYVNGVSIPISCPKCGTDRHIDLGHLSYPQVGVPTDVFCYCHNCDHDWSPGNVTLRIEVDFKPAESPAAPEAHVKRYITYYPEHDAINNCGIPQSINDFFTFGVEGEDMRQLSKDLPTSPEGDFDHAHGGIPLGVECKPGEGFSVPELRAAADAFMENFIVEPSTSSEE